MRCDDLAQGHLLVQIGMSRNKVAAAEYLIVETQKFLIVEGWKLFHATNTLLLQQSSGKNTVQTLVQFFSLQMAKC